MWTGATKPNEFNGKINLLRYLIFILVKKKNQILKNTLF